MQDQKFLKNYFDGIFAIQSLQDVVPMSESDRVCDLMLEQFYKAIDWFEEAGDLTYRCDMINEAIYCLENALEQGAFEHLIYKLKFIIFNYVDNKRSQMPYYIVDLSKAIIGEFEDLYAEGLV